MGKEPILIAGWSRIKTLRFCSIRKYTLTRGCVATQSSRKLFQRLLGSTGHSRQLSFVGAIISFAYLLPRLTKLLRLKTLLTYVSRGTSQLDHCRYPNVSSRLPNFQYSKRHIPSRINSRFRKGLTFERALLITFPLKATVMGFGKQKSGFCFVGCLVLIALAFHLPSLFFMESDPFEASKSVLVVKGATPGRLPFVWTTKGSSHWLEKFR